VDGSTPVACRARVGSYNRDHRRHTDRPGAEDLVQIHSDGQRHTGGLFDSGAPPRNKIASAPLSCPRARLAEHQLGIDLDLIVDAHDLISKLTLI